jgi:hypothetical protein
VRDTNDDPVEGVYIYIKSYDIGTDSSKTTEIVRSDADGEALAQIMLNDQFYLFDLIENGVLIEQTTVPQKIISQTNNIFRIDDDDSFFSYLNTIQNAVTNLTFDNSTLGFTYSFTDTTGGIKEGCLVIRRNTGFSDAIEDQSCITSSSGTITLNISNPKNDRFTAVGYLKLNPTQTTDVLDMNFDNLHDALGLMGMLFAAFLTLTLIMIGIFKPGVSLIGAAAGLVVASFFSVVDISRALLMGVIVVIIVTIIRIKRGSK